jgi:hypothetical protein
MKRRLAEICRSGWTESVKHKFSRYRKGKKPHAPPPQGHPPVGAQMTYILALGRHGDLPLGDRLGKCRAFMGYRRVLKLNLVHRKAQARVPRNFSARRDSHSAPIREAIQP